MAEAWSEKAFHAAVVEAEHGIIDVPDVRMSGDQLTHLVSRLGRADGSDPSPCQAQYINLAGTVVTGDAEFSRVRCVGRASFADATFAGNVGFGDATFEDGVSFRRTRFARAAGFAGARFSGPRTTPADFMNTAFEAEASFEGARCDGTADFALARFAGDVSFDGVQFAVAEFQQARFAHKVSFARAHVERGLFQRASFHGNAGFGKAVFAQLADFEDTRFEGYADFTKCRFAGTARFQTGFQVAGDAYFDQAVFEQEALFMLARFGGEANFRRATFAGFTQFNGAELARNASFSNARFEDDVSFLAVSCGADLSLASARFRDARVLGPLLVDRRLSLDQTSFDVPVRIEAAARQISCDYAVFRSGVDMFARWAEVTATGADFAGASLLAALPAGATANDRGFLGTERPAPDGGWTRDAEPTHDYEPSIASLQGAKVARLTLSRVDLSACRFASAHGLDELRMERVHLPQPPDGWRRRGWRWLRWTRRRTIAEEHRWRREHQHRSGWYEQPVRGPDWLHDSSEALEPAQIASIYRSLRHGRERDRDEPGAGDLYYGEMEMRRMYARRRSSWSFVRPVQFAERATLWLYWLVSGYGLRASRALLALAATILLLAVPLDLWGFRPDRAYGRAVLFAAESCISLLRAPEATLTASGEVVQIALRLAGPLFFGLAVLALRSRVKR